ncbi:MAG: DUF92 domain-containing protein [Balneolia bacterium]|nr:DUF92 domain-containing protein [Balneolia bacterium]
MSSKTNSPVSSTPRIVNLRMLNYAFAVLLVFIFVLAADPFDKILIPLSFLLAAGVSIIAFTVRSLTLDGMKTAILVGTITLGTGGLEFAGYLLFFFVGSNLLGVIFNADAHSSSNGLVERRSSDQVWANSFWFVLFLCLYYIFGYWPFAIASITAIAAANSDTWATITGSSSPKAEVRLITNPAQKVPKGTDGGISLIGSIGGLAGSAAVAGLVWLFQGGDITAGILIIFISGFSGCLIDSYFGAHFQHKAKTLRLAGRTVRPGNNLVNFMAVGFAAFLAIILYNLFVYALV